MSQRRRKVPRCRYTDAGQQCERPGLGEPPLCRAHFELVRYGLPVEEDVDVDARDLLEDLLEHPFARHIRAQLDHLMASLPLANNLSSLSYPFSPDPGKQPQFQGPDRAFASSTNRRPPPRRQPAPPPPQPSAPDPRLVLHFGPNDPVTKQEIEKRRRELARLCHPDRGGSTDAMQRINQAADALLAQVR